LKLTTITHVTVDGVMQGLGAPDEDRRGGFERGGWALPLFDDEAAMFLDQVFQRADAFLFGRRTYEIFAGSWGANQGNNPISVALNTRPKYVASTTLTDPQWADTTVLSGDVAAAIGELKAKLAGELQVHGSGNLVRWLFDNHLVDEIILLTYPVVIGQGTRLFPATGPDTALELVDAQSTPKGVSIQVYRPAGRPQYATVTADLNMRQRYIIGGAVRPQRLWSGRCSPVSMVETARRERSTCECNRSHGVRMSR
jgi:dihydrofolate reductase